MINLEMPDDVHTYVREYQARMKVSRKTGFYSQQQAIISIIREHKEIMIQEATLSQKNLPQSQKPPDL